MRDILAATAPPLLRRSPWSLRSRRFPLARHLFTLPLLTLLALSTVALPGLSGPASAQVRLDPMRSAREGGTPVAADPMAALRAQAAVATDGNAGPAPNDEFGGLPDGPGAEETYYQCVACHSTEIIKQQRLTDARWDDLWGWMIEQQGMTAPDPETKDIILGYLKTHFSAKAVTGTAPAAP